MHSFEHGTLKLSYMESFIVFVYFQENHVFPQI